MIRNRKKEDTRPRALSSKACLRELFRSYSPSRLQLVEWFVYRDPTAAKGLLHPPVPIY